MSEDFDWGPLGEAFWDEASKTCGATPMQARFACCRHRGMTAKLSAKLAGYGDGSEMSLRTSGSRTARTNIVVNMLQLAKVEAAGGDDGTVSLQEARRILSRLARGSDPLVRIRALESLSKIDRDERANRPEEPDDRGETIAWFRELFVWAFNETKTTNIEFAELWRCIVVRILDHTRGGRVTKPGGNGAQAREPAEEGSSAAAA
jgi:hypothetical protein